MYLDFFHLTKEPFHVTPDPEFLFLSESHKQALAAIVYGVKTGKGLITITGPVGSGKTTVLRTFLKNSDTTHFKLIYIFDPAVPFSTLVARLCQEFDIRGSHDDVPKAVEMLYLSLADHFRKGCTVVLIIDEAQNMPVETLERLRMLSNFETTEEKLLQIVLCGQPELEELLKEPSLRSLRQRRAIRATILPLEKKESANYIKHRLSRAGAVDPSLFTSRAMQMLIKEAGGIPRTLNILCDNALATAYAYGKKRIDTRVTREVVRDLQEERPSRWKTGAAMAAAATAVMAVAAVFGLQFLSPSPFHKDLPRSAVVGSTNEAMTYRLPVPAQESGRPIQGAATISSTRAAGTTRIVRKGDTILQLIKDTYHVREPKRISSLLPEVMKTNPDIKNASFIFEGQKVLFPEIKRETLEALK